MNTTRRRTLSLVLAGFMLFNGCRDKAPDTGDTGGTLVVAVPASPRALLPPVDLSTQSTMVTWQIFDRLADIGDNLSTIGDNGFEPQLASSWTWAADSLSIAFTLDSAAKWHDGQPVTAEDVRYTFRTYTSPALQSQQAALLGNIDSVSVPDARTAVVWFKRRTPQQFFDATYHMFILPSHLLSTVADSAIATSQWATAPIGSGRFRFVRWEPNARIEIIADTLNYRGRPKLDRVVFSLVADAGIAVVRLFAGEVDFFEQMRPENVEQVATSNHLRMIPVPSLQYNFLGFNLRDPKNTARPHPIFGDVAVRRAFVLGTDRDRLVRGVFDSLGAVGIGPSSRREYPDTTLFERPAFSLNAARALLDSAGWVDRNNDGVREKDGVRLAFEVLTVASSLPRQRAATQLQEQYRALGAELTLTTIDGTVLGPRLGQGQFDAYMGGWNPNPGMRGLPGVWGTNGRQNFQKYSNREFDSAIDEALSTFDDTRRRNAFGRAFRIIWDDAPSVWLFEPQNPAALHRRVRNAPLRADAWYAHLDEWSIDPAQRIERDRIGLRAEPSR